MGRYKSIAWTGTGEIGAADAWMDDFGAAILLTTLGSPAELPCDALQGVCALCRDEAILESLARSGDLLDIVDDTEAQVFVSTEVRKSIAQCCGAQDGEATSAAHRYPAAILRSTRLWPGSILSPSLPKRDAGPALRVYGFGPGRVDLNGEAVPASTWGIRDGPAVAILC